MPDEERDSSALQRDLEAVLFAAGRPLSLEELIRAASHTTAVSLESVQHALENLEDVYPVDGRRGMELARVGSGWLFRTNQAAEPALSTLFDVGEDARLSPASLETLAIIAYSQPVSRPEIAEIRGVSSDSAVQTLTERGLVAEKGRREGPGGAILYGTTERFQVVFGLGTLDELPPLEDFELSGEEREEIRRRLGLIVAPE